MEDSQPINLKDNSVSPKDKRTRTIQELYTSEVTYVTNLRNMQQGYIEELKRRNILSPSAISSIFSNLEIILKFHVDYFLSELEPQISQWTSTSCVGKTFLALAPCFKLYTQYCANYDQAIAQVQEQRRHNHAFDQFVQEAQKSERFHGSYITSLLILPIQRIPRYEMFLKELVSRTEPSHPDFFDLNEALERVAKKAEEVNEACERVENMQKIMDISLHIEMENLLTPTRLYVDDYDVNLESECYNGPAHCYLFNDLLVLCPKKRKSNMSTPLALCWVQDGSNNSFEIVTHTFNYTLSFPSAERRQTAHKQIKQLVDRLILTSRKDCEMRQDYQLVVVKGVTHAKNMAEVEEGLASGEDRKVKKRGRLLDKWKREVKKGGFARRKKHTSKETEQKIVDHLSAGTPSRRMSVPHESDVINEHSAFLSITGSSQSERTPVPPLKKSQSTFGLTNSSITRRVQSDLPSPIPTQL